MEEMEALHLSLSAEVHGQHQVDQAAKVLLELTVLHFQVGQVVRLS
jgi:hypothetical protein